MSALEEAAPPPGNGNGNAVAAPVQSVDRALTILELLARDGEAGVTEIAQGLGVHKSTAFRLLVTLEAHRLVEQVNDRGRYRLGVGQPAAGRRDDRPPRPGHRGAPGLPPARLRHRRDREHHGAVGDLGAVPRPGGGLLSAAAAQLGRPAHPAARDEQRQGAAERAVRGRAQGRRPRAAAVTPTTRSPPGPGCARTWPRCARRGTPSRSTSSRSGLTAAAAPIRSAHGDIIASMSISGPTFRLDEERLAETVPMLVAAATEVSHRLGWGRHDDRHGSISASAPDP